MKIVKIKREYPKSASLSAVEPPPQISSSFDAAEKEIYAAKLRANPTKSEALMCDLLDKLGIEYEFQPVICGYIPDFLFPAKRKILELDGKVHRSRKLYDQRRDATLRRNGYKVLRVPSSLIFTDVDKLTARIKEFSGLVPKTRKRSGERPQRVEADELLDQFFFATAGI